MKINYDRLPEHMRSGAQLYIEQGIRPGDFLMAILENDLSGAVQRADSINRDKIIDWVEWKTFDIPAIAHGSPEYVSAWISQGGLEGLEARYEDENVEQT